MVFFFCKQKTAYEMRIRDWSSDVCSSDLLPYIMPYALRGSDGGVNLFDAGFGTPAAIEAMTAQLAVLGYAPGDIRRLFISHAHPDHIGMAGWVKEQRSEERRVGKGWVRTC